MVIQYDIPGGEEEERRFDIKVLRKGQLFGEATFFMGINHTYTAKSLNFCVVQKLDRRAFLDLIKDSQYDIEVFCHIRDEMSLYQNYSSVQERICSTCRPRGDGKTVFSFLFVVVIEIFYF